MVILRCTKKLLKRLGGKTNHASASSTNVLGDWYANVISLPFRGKSVTLFLNSKTLLVILIPGRGTQKMFPIFQKSVSDLLNRIDIPHDIISSEIHEMADLVLDQTESRSLLGSLTDIAESVKYVARDYDSADAIDWKEAEDDFTTWMHGPLNYRYPRDIAMELFQQKTKGGT